MADDGHNPDDAARSPPSADTLALLRRRPVQAVAIAAILGIAAAAFAYTGGWLTPDRLSPARFVDGMQQAHGVFPGFRRSHAKGICLAGTFMGTPDAKSWSVASVFNGDPVPVTGRFAESTPNPYAPDSSDPVRSMALRMPAEGGEWRTGMNNTPGLPVSTTEDFFALVFATAPDPQTGKPDPAKVQPFVASHPEMAAYLARAAAKPLAANFVNDSFNSVNGFIYVAPDGQRRLVRWTMRAEAPFSSLSQEEREKAAPNYVFDDLLAQVAAGPQKWRLIATFAEPGDPNKAAELWPEGRREVDMGELIVTHVESEAPGNCRDINFDPMVLPPGIEPSDDPIAYARSAVYSSSFRRRMGEPKSPSAIAGRSAEAPQ
ncbi:MULTISPECIES: catalase family peroxidase [Rhodomicrobium]|uniref:catalase family peroxidase n=1 Tax=Rhodomicrobium TaxID=1068 RepID=UPI000B4AA8B1|nr:MULTISPECIES: catalase family peroxidase [Rhodomicrobium]